MLISSNDEKIKLMKIIQMQFCDRGIEEKISSKNKNRDEKNEKVLELKRRKTWMIKECLSKHKRSILIGSESRGEKKVYR